MPRVLNFEDTEEDAPSSDTINMGQYFDGDIEEIGLFQPPKERCTMTAENKAELFDDKHISRMTLAPESMPLIEEKDEYCVPVVEEVCDDASLDFSMS
jgi:hypothetical protein